MKAIITCTSGTCVVYPTGAILTTGESDAYELGTAAQLPAGAGDAAKAAIKEAASAIGVGCNGKDLGAANLRADGGAMRVRRYLSVNPFLSPDAAGYEDVTLDDGASITAEMIQENVKTLVVLGVA